MRTSTAALSALLTASGVSVAVLVLRRRQLAWGTSVPERRGPLDGDSLEPQPDLVATRAISIAAPASSVMPWLRQLGHERGGFYTYDALENLVGLDMHSADEVHPEWQVGPGDDVLLGPGAPLRVVEATATALVLQGQEPPRGGSPMPFSFTWAFVIAEAGGGCRLLVRERYTYRTWWAALVVEPTTWIAWLMTQRMLRGVRERAERPVGSPRAPVHPSS